VRVDGTPAVLGQRARPDARIEIDARARQQQARLVTVLLHKPVGYVSGQPEDGYPAAAGLFTAANRWREDRSRQSFHSDQHRGLAPAGRLDIDSTGLLVLTQDGRIAKTLIGERSLSARRASGVAVSIRRLSRPAPRFHVAFRLMIGTVFQMPRP